MSNSDIAGAIEKCSMVGESVQECVMRLRVKMWSKIFEVNLPCTSGIPRINSLKLRASSAIRKSFKAEDILLTVKRCRSYMHLQKEESPEIVSEVEALLKALAAHIANLELWANISRQYGRRYKGLPTKWSRRHVCFIKLLSSKNQWIRIFSEAWSMQRFTTRHQRNTWHNPLKTGIPVLQCNWVCSRTPKSKATFRPTAYVQKITDLVWQGFQAAADVEWRGIQEHDDQRRSGRVCTKRWKAFSEWAPATSLPISF